MSLPSVRSAGNRHSYGGQVAGAGVPYRPVACQGCAGQRHGVSGGADCRRRVKRQVRWALPSVRASGRDLGSVRERQQRAPDTERRGIIVVGWTDHGRLPYAGRLTFHPRRERPPGAEPSARCARRSRFPAGSPRSSGVQARPDRRRPSWFSPSGRRLRRSAPR